MMAGYWGDPSNTEKSFIDEWLRTGDLAHQDGGRILLFFVRWIKNIIVKGGSNIAPPEIEEAIAAHLSVEACGVIEDPDPALGVGTFTPSSSSKPAQMPSRPTPEELARIRQHKAFTPQSPRSPDLCARTPSHYSRKDRPQASCGFFQKSVVSGGNGEKCAKTRYLGSLPFSPSFQAVSNMMSGIVSRERP